MSKYRKRKLIRAAVILGILLIAGLLYISGVFDDNAHFLIINRADDDIYEIILDISYTGDVTRNIHAGIQVAGKLKNYHHDHYPIPYGEKIHLDPGHRKDVVVGDRAEINFYVKTEQPKDTLDSRGTRILNTPMSVPLAKGKRTVLILTGSKERGYTLTPDGFAHWIFG